MIKGLKIACAIVVAATLLIPVALEISTVLGIVALALAASNLCVMYIIADCLPEEDESESI